MSIEKPEHPLLSPRNFWPASLYLLLLGILSAVLVELNKDYHWVRLEWLAGALFVVVLVGGYRLFERLRKSFTKGRETIVLREKKDVGGAVALIAFASQGPGKTSGLQAASYHAGQGTLQHLWLITTRAAEADAHWVTEQLRSQYSNVRIHEFQFLDDKDSIQEAKGMVEHLRQRAMAEFHISEPDIICDFTGLTKNASAGMILACAPKPARLQYMVPNRVDEGGRADPSAGSSPREVFIQYMVIEEH